MDQKGGWEVKARRRREVRLPGKEEDKKSPALLKCATPYEDLLPFCSAHSPFTRLSKRRKGGQQIDSVPLLFRCTRFISPTHKEGRGGKKAALASVRTPERKGGRTSFSDSAIAL
nr:unnamed protein product [Digitaria exilis]CAB3504700.1 unnamed protein product [Digitaria exilis]